MLTNDCGSDMSAGAEKDELWDWDRCACHCLNIAVQAALKEPVIEVFGTLDGIGTQILQEPECMEPAQGDVARNTKLGGGVQR